MGEVRILVVDDDRAVRDALRARSPSLDTRWSWPRGAAGPDRGRAQSLPDAVVLDVGMPGLDGLEVCRRLRAAGNRVPVLMLTARDAVDDRIDGLDAGADDYLVKPFDVGELKARLRALMRRAAGEPTRDAAARSASCGWTAARHGVAVGDEFAELTRTEYQLLELLMLNPRRVLPPASSTSASGATTSGPRSNALRVYIGYLRRKLEEAGRRAADPHGARRRLRAARAVSLRPASPAAGSLRRRRAIVVLAAVIVYSPCRSRAARADRRRAAPDGGPRRARGARHRSGARRRRPAGVPLDRGRDPPTPAAAVRRRARATCSS